MIHLGQKPCCSRNCKTATFVITGGVSLISGVVIKALSKDNSVPNDNTWINSVGTGILSSGILLFIIGVIYHCLCAVQDHVDQSNTDIVIAEQSETSLMRTQTTELPSFHRQSELHNISEEEV